MRLNILIDLSNTHCSREQIATAHAIWSRNVWQQPITREFVFVSSDPVSDHDTTEIEEQAEEAHDHE